MPQCDYCYSTNVRMTSNEIEGRGIIPPSYFCEDCFVGTDNGPCWDDHPRPRENIFEEKRRDLLPVIYVLGGALTLVIFSVFLTLRWVGG